MSTKKTAMCGLFGEDDCGRGRDALSVPPGLRGDVRLGRGVPAGWEVHVVLVGVVNVIGQRVALRQLGVGPEEQNRGRLADGGRHNVEVTPLERRLDPVVLGLVVDGEGDEPGRLLVPGDAPAR